MTWEEMLNIPIPEASTGQAQTDIECPACGKNIYLNTSIVLTTYPETYHYWCSCGWYGYSHVKWSPNISSLTQSLFHLS